MTWVWTLAGQMTGGGGSGGGGGGLTAGDGSILGVSIWVLTGIAALLILWWH